MSARAYTAAEIADAFPPRIAPPRRTRQSAARAPGSDWEPEKILSALLAIDARLRKSGPFTAQGDHPGDKAILGDWSLRAFWHRAIAAIHHASGGSEAGFELSCQVSGGDSSMGLVGCLSKFDRADQRRVWDSMSGSVSPVTMGTIYWIARDFAGWTSGRRGRPMKQPRESGEIPAQAQAVADAGRWAVSKGLNRVRKLHAIGAQRLRPGTRKRRLLEAIGTGLDPRTGMVAIGSLTLMAGKLSCNRETVRRYLRELEQEELIIKNRGNATSMPGTRGIIIALA
jgi:Primase C terminal 2 (PriCT-2)